MLVAEGDSWFDYPFYDVLQKLDDDFGWDIENVAHRGDSVESMAYDGGQLADFVRAIQRVVRRGDVPHAILMSGGGNDVAGDSFAMLLNHRSSPVYGFNSGGRSTVSSKRAFASRTRRCCRRSRPPARISSARRCRYCCTDTTIRWPMDAASSAAGALCRGRGSSPASVEKGYDDLAERVAIARDLIDRLYAMLAAVVALPAFAHVQVVDLRNALSTDLVNNRYKTWWGNELHPTQQGFSKVAGLFDAKL